MGGIFSTTRTVRNREVFYYGGVRKGRFDCIYTKIFTHQPSSYGGSDIDRQFMQTKAETPSIKQYFKTISWKRSQAVLSKFNFFPFTFVLQTLTITDNVVKIYRNYVIVYMLHDVIIDIDPCL